MTFFYDLNKKMAELAKPKAQLNEGAVAERATGDYSAKKARAGKDIGKPGKAFAQIAKSAGERYGSKERGEKVAGAVLAKLRAKEDVEEGLGDVVKKVGGAMKQAAGKAIEKLGHGSDEELIRDLQKKAGVPQTGQKPGHNKPMSEADVEEGNYFTGQLAKARAAGKKQADLDGDGDMEKIREASKPDYIDLDKDGNRKESMKKAAADKKAGKHKEEELDEGWDDMLKDVERRRSGMKTGEKVQGHKGEIEKTATGIKHTRKYDPKTGETDSGEDDAPKGEKRRGRPKGTGKAMGAKGPSGKSKLMTREEIDEAIAALEEAGYSVEERKLSSSEKEEREDIVKGMKKNKAEFKKRYGDRGEEVMYATATKLAKERGPGNPDRKKKEKTEESGTVAGSVATAPAASTGKSKGGFTFGKGIYDSMNRELENMISESMNVSVNMSVDQNGQPHKNITVSAEGEAAEQLAQLLNLAGLQGAAHDHGETCDVCGSADCGCNEMVDENAPDWPTNTEMGGEDDPHLQLYAGGLNKPKETGQTTVPVVNRDPARGSFGPAESSADVKESKDLGMKLYAELKSFKA